MPQWKIYSGLKGALAEGADPRLWARQYPWATLGVSAIAGFVATSILVPSREQQALKKLAEIERALNPEPRRREERERDDHPDSVFVEDTVVVCDGLAVLTRPGAPARRGEVAGTAATVREPGLGLARLERPGPLAAGDVVDRSREKRRACLPCAQRRDRHGHEQQDEAERGQHVPRGHTAIESRFQHGGNSHFQR